MSVHTSTWPSQRAPAPMPIVGIASSSVIRAATGSGTISRTIATAPASASAAASATSASAASSPRPCTRKPPSLLTDWGVKPRWPTTGMPASPSARTVRARGRPPSSLTALAPAFIRRTALASAWAGPAS